MWQTGGPLARVSDGGDVTGPYAITPVVGGVLVQSVQQDPLHHVDWLGLIVQEYYAGTEGSGLTYISAEDWLAHPGSVGRAMLGVLHVCDVW